MQISCALTGLRSFNNKRYQITNHNFIKRFHPRSYFTSNHGLCETANVLSTTAPVVTSTNLWRTGSCNSNATNTYSYLFDHERRKVSYGNLSQRQQRQINTCASASYERILAPWNRNNINKRRDNLKSRSIKTVTQNQFWSVGLNFYKLSSRRQQQLNNLALICKSHLLTLEIGCKHYNDLFLFVNLRSGNNVAYFSSKNSGDSKSPSKRDKNDNKDSSTSQQTNADPLGSKKTSKKRSKNKTDDQATPLTQPNNDEPSSNKKLSAKKRVKEYINDQVTPLTPTPQDNIGPPQNKKSSVKKRVEESRIDQTTPPSPLVNKPPSNKKSLVEKHVEESRIYQATPPPPCDDNIEPLLNKSLGKKGAKENRVDQATTLPSHDDNIEPPLTKSLGKKRVKESSINQATPRSPLENEPPSNKKSLVKKRIEKIRIDQVTLPSSRVDNIEPPLTKSLGKKDVKESGIDQATTPPPRDNNIEPPSNKKPSVKKRVKESSIAPFPQGKMESSLNINKQKIDTDSISRKQASPSSRKKINTKQMLSPEILIYQQLQTEASVEEIWSTYLQLEATSKITLLKRENFIAIINQILKNYNSFVAPPKISKILQDMKLCKYSIRQHEKNLIIEVYLRNGNFNDARTLFDEIHNAKIEREFEAQSYNPFTKAANLMIEAYGKEKNLDQIDEILKTIKRKIILPDVGTNKILKEVVLNNIGNGSSAWFDQLVIRQLVNSVLAREICIEFAKIGKFNDALELYVNMKAVNMQLELGDFLTIINELKKRNHEKEALDMIDELVSSKLVLNQEALDIISGSYLEAISLEKAHDFLIELIKRGYDLDIKFFNNLIQKYARLGKVNSTLSLVTRMRSAGILPDFDTYTSLLELFVKVNDTNAMEKIFARMKSEGFDANLAIYNLLTRGYARSYDVQKAFEVCRTMLGAGIEPNEFTYNALISFFAEKSDPIGATMLYNEMKKFDLPSNVFTYTSLVKAHAWTSDIHGAEKIMRNMRIAGVEPNAPTYNIIMNARSKNRDFESCQLIFQEMVRLNVQPNNHTYSCLMEGLCRLGNMQAAESILARLKNTTDTKPDVFHYTMLMNAYVKHKKLERVFELYEEMLKEKIEPTYFTYAILINGHARMGNIEFARKLLSELIEQSKKTVKLEDIEWQNKLPAQAFTPLMDAYAKQGQSEKAKEIFAEMLSHGIRPEGHAYTILMDAYRYGGDYQAVWQMWQILRQDPEIGYLDIAESRSNLRSLKMRLKALEASNKRLIEGSEELEALPLQHPPRPPPHALSILMDVLITTQRFDIVEKEWRKLKSEGFSFDSDNLNSYSRSLILSRRIIEACDIIKQRLIRGWNSQLAFWRLDTERPKEELKSQKHELLRRKPNQFYPQKKTLILLGQVLEKLKSGELLIVNNMLEESIDYRSRSSSTTAKILTMDDIMQIYPDIVTATEAIGQVERYARREQERYQVY
ncbi:4605_t:CDS:1 [Ambispora gerdemannii]|uniref:4605_t:CDS:1 n=1 Tax=Ambispora gerdemannii TaxID=144530 RepID=A0A9N9C399_9GLOM|nr:4605_t:CDS:1 [Ambispora gerdemannii]